MFVWGSNPACTLRTAYCVVFWRGCSGLSLKIHEICIHLPKKLQTFSIFFTSTRPPHSACSFVRTKPTLFVRICSGSGTCKSFSFIYDECADKNQLASHFVLFFLIHEKLLTLPLGRHSAENTWAYQNDFCMANKFSNGGYVKSSKLEFDPYRNQSSNDGINLKHVWLDSKIDFDVMRQYLKYISFNFKCNKLNVGRKINLFYYLSSTHWEWKTLYSVHKSERFGIDEKFIM